MVLCYVWRSHKAFVGGRTECRRASFEINFPSAVASYRMSEREREGKLYSCDVRSTRVKKEYLGRERKRERGRERMMVGINQKFSDVNEKPNLGKYPLSLFSGFSLSLSLSLSTFLLSLNYDSLLNSFFLIPWPFQLCHSITDQSFDRALKKQRLC